MPVGLRQSEIPRHKPRVSIYTTPRRCIFVFEPHASAMKQ